jgi:hypothetical protein
MNRLRVSPLLQFALLLDAVATAASGFAMLLFAAELESALRLPATLMTYAGIFMLAYALVVAIFGTRTTLPRWAVWAVIVGNTLWAIDCIALAFAGIFAPSALGIAFLLTQAVFVLGLAELQYFGLRRSAVAA